MSLPINAKNKNYYEILGVAKTADQIAIKKAYIQLAKIKHPDKVPEDKKQEATREFQEISEAYAVLSDPAQRRAYDNLRDSFGCADEQEHVPQQQPKRPQHRQAAPAMGRMFFPQSRPFQAEFLNRDAAPCNYRPGIRVHVIYFGFQRPTSDPISKLFGMFDGAKQRPLGCSFSRFEYGIRAQAPSRDVLFNFMVQAMLCEIARQQVHFHRYPQHQYGYQHNEDREEHLAFSPKFH